ncbi:HopJ type III effector protein [Algoriella xinjiangensis]|uniref:HopJ type III effector protein n=1 Tax=Algoriella xinjiangensis TaxID=684065 RepID=A0A1I4WMB7_9FLAO|nr:HopJ type III effector protein [Algoriella xinjiangensis]SFN14931.1 HopJ type III effector protein [Algoriella xinjiangensis]VDH16792.1 HopJ type III effector protein [Algoriella xinjiangensis]
MILEKLNNNEIIFADVLAFIDDNYNYTPTAFTNGNQENAIDQNQGSAKVLAFAKLNDYTENDTLKLFAEHYKAVIKTPNGTDHNNIRQFMQNGWNGVSFENDVLTKK